MIVDVNGQRVLSCCKQLSWSFEIFCFFMSVIAALYVIPLATDGLENEKYSIQINFRYSRNEVIFDGLLESKKELIQAVLVVPVCSDLQAVFADAMDTNNLQIQEFFPLLIIVFYSKKKICRDLNSRMH